VCIATRYDKRCIATRYDKVYSNKIRQKAYSNNVRQGVAATRYDKRCIATRYGKRCIATRYDKRCGNKARRANLQAWPELCLRFAQNILCSVIGKRKTNSYRSAYLGLAHRTTSAVCWVGQNHTFLGIYGVYTEFSAGKSPYIRSYTVCIYGSGQT